MNNKIGRIGWIDLTVQHAKDVRDFYEQVVGWSSDEQDMGGYADYDMQANGDTVTGICHQRGMNARIPSQWMIYIMVDNLEHRLSCVTELGGQVLDKRVHDDGSAIAYIKDPSGAVCALWQAAKS